MNDPPSIWNIKTGKSGRLWQGWGTSSTAAMCCTQGWFTLWEIPQPQVGGTCLSDHICREIDGDSRAAADSLWGEAASVGYLVGKWTRDVAVVDFSVCKQSRSSWIMKKNRMVKCGPVKMERNKQQNRPTGCMLIVSPQTMIRYSRTFESALRSSNAGWYTLSFCG